MYNIRTAGGDTFFVLALVANTHVANHIWQLVVLTFGIYLTHNVAPLVLSAHEDGAKSSSQFIVQVLFISLSI
jgi:hypothetical protein